MGHKAVNLSSAAAEYGCLATVIKDKIYLLSVKALHLL